MEKTINTEKTIHDVIDIDVLNDLVDKAVGKSVYDIEYKEINLYKEGNIILNVTYEED